MLKWTHTGLTVKEADVLRERLQLLDIPAQETAEPCDGWHDDGVDAFLRRATWTCFMSSECVPGMLLFKYLSLNDPFPSSVLRRAAELSDQLSLVLSGKAEHIKGGHAIGSLRIGHPGENGAVSMALPKGVWTDLLTGEEYTGCVDTTIAMRTQLILCAPHAVIPVAVNMADPVDRITLHWFRPEGRTELSVSGMRWELRCDNGDITWKTNADKPWHLIIHQAEEERFIR